MIYDAVPLSGFDGLLDDLVRAHGVRKPVEQHAVNLHPLGTDRRFAHGLQPVRTQVLVAVDQRRGCSLSRIIILNLGRPDGW